MWSLRGSRGFIEESYAGVLFNCASNVSLLDCTFQHSQVCVCLSEVSDNTLVQNCNFLTNYYNNLGRCGRLQISGTSCENVSVIISQSKFFNNSGGGLFVNTGEFQNEVCKWFVSISQTNFLSNTTAVRLIIIRVLDRIQIVEDNFYDNNAVANGVAGISVEFLASGSNSSSLSVLSSVFSYNSGRVLFCSGDVALLIVTQPLLTTFGLHLL